MAVFFLVNNFKKTTPISKLWKWEKGMEKRDRVRENKTGIERERMCNKARLARLKPGLLWLCGSLNHFH